MDKAETLKNLKVMAEDLLNGSGNSIHLTLDDKHFAITDPKEFIGAAKGILLACKALEVSEPHISDKVENDG